MQTVQGKPLGDILLEPGASAQLASSCLVQRCLFGRPGGAGGDLTCCSVQWAELYRAVISTCISQTGSLGNRQVLHWAKKHNHIINY